MKTIKQHLIRNLEKRKERLKEIRAPEVCISGMDIAIKNIDRLKGHEYFPLEIMKTEVKTGRGGKKYRVFKTEIGNVFYFPQARFGPFLKKEEIKT